MDILSNLNPEQQKAVTATKGPVLVLAGAGSGKTRTLTHRIAYLIAKELVAPSSILAVTFTNKAAEEMKMRLGQMLSTCLSTRQAGSAGEPCVGTFHSISARVLREDGGNIGIQRHFSILDEDDQRKIVRQTLAELNISGAEFRPQFFVRAIDRIKRERILYNQIQSVLSEFFSPPLDEIVFRVYLAYEERIKKVSALDFNDLLLKTVELWDSDLSAREKYQQRWQYILVDEYQDTNIVQYEWCRLLSEAHRNLFVVGDDYQSIYRFRGADVGNILNFKSQYKDAQKILLEENYRSTAPILSLANAVMEANHKQERKRLWTKRNGGDLPKIVEVEDEREEAQFVIDTVLNAKCQMPNVKTINLNNFVVLYRTNAQSRAIEEALLHNRIPYRIIGGITFYERKEVKDILGFLKILANPNDSLSAGRIINIPPRGIGEKTYERFCSALPSYDGDIFRVCSAILGGALPECARMALFCTLIHELRELSNDLTPSECADMIIEKIGYKEYMERYDDMAKERSENLAELKTVAGRFSSEKGREGLISFLEEVALATPLDAYSRSENAMTLMTAHAAKGLEFSTVFMVGMEQGLFPHSSSAFNPEELGEERRLCYVGITRAKDSLYLIHARTRKLFGETKYAEISEFLDGLGKDVAKRIFL